jgi:hypothetical protein
MQKYYLYKSIYQYKYAKLYRNNNKEKNHIRKGKKTKKRKEKREKRKKKDKKGKESKKTIIKKRVEKNKK